MTDLPPPSPGQQPGWFPAPDHPPVPGPPPPFTPPRLEPVPPQPVDGPAPGDGPARRHRRLPAAIAALAVVSLGVATAVVLTRDDDGDAAATVTTPSVTQPTATTVAATTTTAVTEPTTTVTTTTTVATSTTVTSVPPTPAPPLPDGAIIVTDPAGWALAVDPLWTETTQDGRRNWFTNTGVEGSAVDDNVNVTTEVLMAPLTLDSYVDAALAGIAATAPDFQLFEQRRVVGPDGVVLAVISWSGTLPGLPTLALLQAVTVTPTAAYVATFTTESSRLGAVAPAVEPYLVSLRGA